MAKKHGLAEAEYTLRWITHHSLLKREYSDAVIIGASSTKHLEENLVDLEKGQLPGGGGESVGYWVGEDEGWGGEVLALTCSCVARRSLNVGVGNMYTPPRVALFHKAFDGFSGLRQVLRNLKHSAAASYVH